jgi:uncharacterized protein YhfF
MNTVQIEQYWQRYLKTLQAQIETQSAYLVDQFGDSPELANELGQLVIDGVKTATCSALWEWEASGSAPPFVGVKTIFLDGANPICIVETTEVVICPFDEVDAQFAYDEGLCDRTLESWRREHWDYFWRTLPKIGFQPTSKMLLVCERFRVVYAELS